NRTRLRALPEPRARARAARSLCCSELPPGGPGGPGTTILGLARIGSTMRRKEVRRNGGTGELLGLQLAQLGPTETFTIWPLSGHSGHQTATAEQPRFMSTQPNTTLADLLTL